MDLKYRERRGNFMLGGCERGVLFQARHDDQRLGKVCGIRLSTSGREGGYVGDLETPLDQVSDRVVVEPI